MKNMKKIVEVLAIIGAERKPGKKMVQKLLYLMERKGLELGLDYRIHFFGPYSSILDNNLHALQNSEIIDIDTSGYTHTISVVDADICEGEGLSPGERELVRDVIDNFANKTALDLEAITTLDYVAMSMGRSDELDKQAKQEIIEGVQNIKGSKFSESQLNEYLEILKNLTF